MLTLKRSHSLQSLQVPSLTFRKEKDAAKLEILLVRWSLFNFILVAAVGVLMRAMPFLSHFPLSFKNVLHGHSHFAFGGWVMPLLLALILRGFPELRSAVAYRHWRNISLLLMVSAYGMLLAFPLKGYQPVSIFFATLSIVAGYFLAWVIWSALRRLPDTTGHRFLKAGLFYLTLASVGPFATGPLVALGYQDSTWYFDAIYGYLHFTYNGWFVFAVLALIYQSLDHAGRKHQGNRVFWLMHVACIPAYALSVLWHQPPVWFNWIGGIASGLQLVATCYLLRDALPLAWITPKVRWMVVLALTSLVVKHLLQAGSALPVFAQMAAMSRSLVIAYLHLVLIGFVSMYMLAQLVGSGMAQLPLLMRRGLLVFLSGFVFTELVLVMAGLHVAVPSLTLSLLSAALVMLLGLCLLFAGALKEGVPLAMRKQ